jgi:hypothetical protein
VVNDLMAAVRTLGSTTVTARNASEAWTRRWQNGQCRHRTFDAAIDVQTSRRSLTQPPDSSSDMPRLRIDPDGAVVINAGDGFTEEQLQESAKGYL